MKDEEGGLYGTVKRPWKVGKTGEVMIGDVRGLVRGEMAVLDCKGSPKE